MEQLVARWAHNPKVTGSSPVPATKPGRNVWLFFVKFKLTFIQLLCILFIFYTAQNTRRPMWGLPQIWRQGLNRIMNWEQKAGLSDIDLGF